MSFISGVNHAKSQGIQILHDHNLDGYVGISTRKNNDSTAIDTTSFSITSSDLENIITSSDLTLEIKSLTIPSLVHDDDAERILVVTRDGRIKSTYSSNTTSTTMLWFVMFGITFYNLCTRT
jgi:hypothetical protein